MFSGLRKIVSNGKVGEVDQHFENDIEPPDLLMTPSIDRSRSKKRRLDNIGLSAKKKKELVDRLPQNTILSTPFTPSRTPISNHPNPRDKTMTTTKNVENNSIGNKDKKVQWYHRGSVKNLKLEVHDEPKPKRRNSMGPKTLLERRWSQVSQVANFRKKKRNSLQPIMLNQENEIIAEKLSEESDYVRVSKVEYEKIKNRVSNIERRISFELDQANMQQKNSVNSVDSTKMETVENIEKVITAYEHTLEQNEAMSPTTDHLARRLSKELNIRKSSQEKHIRSPSARKIGSLRRRSREIEKRQLKRNQSWHVAACQSNLKPHSYNIPDSKKTVVYRPVTRSTSVYNNGKISINLENKSSKLENSTHWVSANGFFSDTSSDNTPPITQNKHTFENGRTSIAKLRSQNAGMVLAKAKLFDNVQDLNSSSTKSNDVSCQLNKTGSRCSGELKRVQVLKFEDKKVKKTSPRRRPNKQKTCVTKEEEKNISTLNFTGDLNSPTSKNSPHIKKNLNTRSPKRLFRKPVKLDTRTPLKVMVTRTDSLLFYD